MNKKVIPGLYTSFTDNTIEEISFNPNNVLFIGPTYKGPINIPTYVNSYKEFAEIFGKIEDNDELYIPYAVKFATQYAGAIVVRTPLRDKDSYRINENDELKVVVNPVSTSSEYTNVAITSNSESVGKFKIAYTEDAIEYETDELDISSMSADYKIESNSIDIFNVVRVHDAIVDAEDITISSESEYAYYSNAETSFITSSTDENLFKFKTISDGEVANNETKIEILNIDSSSDYDSFDVLVRDKNDTDSRKIILESYPGVNLNPDSVNYIGRKIGDARYDFILRNGHYRTEYNGVYENKSKYIYVDIEDDVKNGVLATGSIRLDLEFTYSFTGGYNGIKESYKNDGTTLMQGYDMTTESLDLNIFDNILDMLKNKFDYKFNILSIPGMNLTDHLTGLVDKVNNFVKDDRSGDFKVLLDATNEACDNISEFSEDYKNIDNEYFISYYPWIYIKNNGKYIKTPSVVDEVATHAKINSMYNSFNPPAGYNYGILENTLKPAIKLTPDDIKLLAAARVNPIISKVNKPGIVNFKQMTMFDDSEYEIAKFNKIYVMNTLIKYQNELDIISDDFVFESNNTETRGEFVQVIDPIFKEDLSSGGLDDYKIICNGKNNGDEVQARDEMHAEIEVKFNGIGEYIYIPFYIQSKITE